MADDYESTPTDSIQDFERLAAEAAAEKYVLRLYVSGMTPRSLQAISSLTAMCDEHLKDRYELEVIDIYKHPELAIQDQIFATPTLIKSLPLPLRSLVGTLSDENRVLIGLNLTKKSDQ
jgi:circadian clock protein KaiB